MASIPPWVDARWRTAATDAERAYLGRVWQAIRARTAELRAAGLGKATAERHAYDQVTARLTPEHPEPEPLPPVAGLALVLDFTGPAMVASAAPAGHPEVRP